MTVIVIAPAIPTPANAPVPAPRSPRSGRLPAPHGWVNRFHTG